MRRIISEKIITKESANPWHLFALASNFSLTHFPRVHHLSFPRHYFSISHLEFSGLPTSASLIMIITRHWPTRTAQAMQRGSPATAIIPRSGKITHLRQPALRTILHAYIYISVCCRNVSAEQMSRVIKRSARRGHRITATRCCLSVSMSLAGLGRRTRSCWGRPRSRSSSSSSFSSSAWPCAQPAASSSSRRTRRCRWRCAWRAA